MCVATQRAKTRASTGPVQSACVAPRRSAEKRRLPSSAASPAAELRTEACCNPATHCTAIVTGRTTSAVPPSHCPHMNFELLARQTLTDACSAHIPVVDEGAACGRSGELCIAAVIGFSGDYLRGTLGVAASADGLERVRRHFGAPDTRLGAADALGELANLVLGQVKREWSRYGVLATLSTPLVMRGVSIEVCGQSDEHWYEQQSGVGADRVTVWLDAHAEDGLEVEPEPVDSGLMNGGDALMF